MTVDSAIVSGSTAAAELAARASTKPPASKTNSSEQEIEHFDANPPAAKNAIAPPLADSAIITHGPAKLTTVQPLVDLHLQDALYSSRADQALYAEQLYRFLTRTDNSSAEPRLQMILHPNYIPREALSKDNAVEILLQAQNAKISELERQVASQAAGHAQELTAQAKAQEAELAQQASTHAEETAALTQELASAGRKLGIRDISPQAWMAIAASGLAFPLFVLMCDKLAQKPAGT